MRLEQLYPDIHLMSDTEATTFIMNYSNRREQDLSRIASTEPKPKITKIAHKEQQVVLSSDQIELLKKLKLL